MAHRTHTRRGSARGVTFIEVLIGAALIALFFFGIIGGFQLALKTIGYARAEAGALAIANEQIEYLRSLPYDDVGTVGGIPAGAIAQNQTVTLNGLGYNRRTLIQYIDAPEDGTGASDDNGITADYKRAKVEISWTARGDAKTLSLVTNLIPRSIETLDGGGTLTVNVFDASAQPVSGAEVRVQNASTSPSIDVTVYTNASGTAMFPGAPASGGYMVSATKSGYSTDQTYAASVGNPNPNPPHASVLEGEVSTLNFAIDRTSTLAVRTVLPPVLTHSDDSFVDQTGIAASTSTVIMSGALTLATSSGLYLPSGSMRTVTIAPSSLYAWSEASWSAMIPASTALRAHIYVVDAGGSSSLVPDSALPGNAAGFTTTPIDLSALAVGDYPRLALGFELESSSGIDTPSIEDRRMSYFVADTPVAGVAYLVDGAKNIGTNSMGVPIKKYAVTHTSPSSGVVVIDDLEWDLYDITIDGTAEGYDVGDVCSEMPVTVAPNTVSTTTLVLVDHTTRSLLVRAEGASGNAIEGASVHLMGGSVDETEATSACGYVHFAGLPIVADYTVAVSAPGYTTETVLNVTVGGTESLVVTLSES